MKSVHMRPVRLRRPLAALFAATAAGSALAALRPGPPPSVRVLAAARDLPAGTALSPSDLRDLALPPAAVPSGAIRSGGNGRVLAGPMRRGEPLTDVRVIGDGLLRAYGSDTVATPIRVADADTVRLLHTGDRIDVLSVPPPDGAFAASRASPEWGKARSVASSLPVVAVPPRDEDGGKEGALVVVATDRAQATALAGAGPGLAVTITGG